MFYLYLTSKEESLVRSSEIAGELESLSLKKSEFKDFLMKSDLYKNLIEMRDFRFDDMKRNMLKNIDQIKDTFIGIPEDESDQDIIDNILYGVYEDIVEDSSNKMISFIDPDGIKRLIGAIKKEENDFYSKFLKKRFSFKNHDDFFIFWQKKINFEANKVIKKISKLIDMRQDDKPNPIMDKINKRADGKCILKPELYDEFVISPKNEKKEYKKSGLI